jgi:putative membrane protein
MIGDSEMLASAYSVVSGWTFEPTVVVPLAASTALYLHAVRLARRRGRPGAWSRRSAWFLTGIVVLFVALEGPIDALSDERLWVHMVQHLLLMVVAPPLLLLGRPLTLAHAASSARTRATLVRVSKSRLVRLVGSPSFGFGLFTVVMWGSHLSSLYEAALTNDAVHAVEHVAYLTAASLFWWPIVAKDPGADRLSYPGRLFYLFLSMPVMSLLGFVVSSSDRVLYPHYVPTNGSLAAALADQRLGGTIMWESSMLAGAVALSLVLIAWMRYDEIEARRADSRRGRDAVALEVNGG